jgi:hypothetical protein
MQIRRENGTYVKKVCTQRNMATFVFIEFLFKKKELHCGFVHHVENIS